MGQAVRNLLVVLPLGAMLAGCGGSHQGIQSSVQRPTQASTHTAARTGTGAVGQSNPRSDAILGYSADDSYASDPLYYITLDQIREHVQNGTAGLIDARSPESFARGHVRGALNLPAGEQMETYLAQIREYLAPDLLIVLYCSNSSCGSSDMVYEYLQTQGFTNMRVFRPGWKVLGPANL